MTTLANVLWLRMERLDPILMGLNIDKWEEGDGVSEWGDLPSAVQSFYKDCIWTVFRAADDIGLKCHFIEPENTRYVIAEAADENN